jgi:hypothetical protein
MHDEREWWRPYVAAVEVAGASGDDRAQSSYYSADQAKEGEWIAPRGPMPGASGAAAAPSALSKPDPRQVDARMSRANHRGLNATMFG